MIAAKHHQVAAIVLVFSIVTSCTPPATLPAHLPLIGSPPTSMGSSQRTTPVSSSTLSPEPTRFDAPFNCAFAAVSPPPPSGVGPLEPGEYIAYFMDSEDSKLLVIKATNGDTRRVVPIPADASLALPDAESGISPDGRYFVYYTGGPTWGLVSSKQQEYDLALHLTSVSQGVDVTTIPLLTQSLPENIRQSALGYAQHPPPGYEGASLEDIASGLFDAFLIGITTVAWSPDSRFLAFAGARQGPSSDIYVFDTANGNTRRLTDGPEEIVKIDWSPGGQWIMHGSAAWWGMGSSLTNHAVSVDGASVVSFPFGGPYERGWLTQTQYLVGEGANGIGSYDLALLDIESARRISLWPHSYGALAFDDSGSKILLTTFGDALDDPPPGLYMLDASTTASTILDDFALWDITYWGAGPYEFAAAKYEDGLFGVTPDGALVRLLDGNWRIAVSPDRRSLALYGNDAMPGLYLLDEPHGAPRLLDTREVTSIQWSPDSSWILFSHGRVTEGETLYVVGSDGGQARLVQELLPGMCLYPSPIWLEVR